MLNRWCRVLIGACVLSLALTACDAILGGDFKVVPASITGGAGPGGAGGGGTGGEQGGGTGAARAPFVCAWRPDSQRVVGSLEEEPGAARRWDRQIHGVLIGDALRVMVWRRMDAPDPAIVDMHTINVVGGSYGSFEAEKLHQLRRIDNGRIAALTTVQPQGTGGAAGAGGGGPQSQELHLHVVLDSDPSGANAADVQLTTQEAFADGDVNPDLRAVFAPVGNGDGSSVGDVPFFARYVDSGFRFRGVYGYYEGAPLTPVPITEPSANLSDDRVRPSTMEYHDGTSYVFTGEGEGAPEGVFEYVLASDTSGPVEPRSFEPPTLMPGTLQLYGDHANLFLANLNTDPFVLEVLVGQFEPGALGSFGMDDLDVAASWPSLDEVPLNVVEGAFLGWGGDTLMIIGGPPQGTHELVLLFVGDRADLRGEVHLPLEVDIEPGGNRAIRSTFVTPQFPDSFEGIGGELHVLWLEEHETTSQPELYSVLYYGLVDCDLASQ